MTGIIFGVYIGLLDHYKEKWRKNKIDQRFQEWEEGQELRIEMGFDDKQIRKIPKRRIKNNGARKKHCY